MLYVGLEMNPRSPRAPWRPDSGFYVAYAQLLESLRTYAASDDAGVTV